MNRDVERLFINYLIRPPLIVIKFLFSPIYQVLFAWIDRRVTLGYERRLERDIHDSLSFLFDEYHGRVVQSQGVPFPLGFDYAIVTVEIENLLIRFCRGRGELDVRIASGAEPNDWYELSAVLALLDNEDAPQRLPVANLPEASRLLRPQLDRLKRTLGEKSNSELKHRLTGIRADERIAIRQTEWEMNRRLR